MARDRLGTTALSDVDKRTPALAAVFAFLCFFPYPALPLGSATGLQASHVFAILLLPLVVLGRRPGRSVIAFVIFVGSLLVSAFFSLLIGNVIDSTIMLRTIVAIILAVIVLVPAGYVINPANVGALGGGVALAIIVHAGIGLYQEYSFSHSTFPLLGLYRNPSFLAMDGVAEDYALWIHRPFGLFPEPSAMTSSTGPWVIVLAGILLNRGWRRKLARPLKILFMVAAVAGATLVLLGRSGYGPLWLVALTPVLLFSSGRFQGMVRTRSPWAGMAVAIGLVFLVTAAIFARGQIDSDNVEQNDSWQARQQSIVIALTAPSQDPARFAFGFGPGQTATYLLGTPTEDLLPQWYESSSVEQVTAVWSMLGVLYMEMGIIGVALIGAMLMAVLRSVLHSSARVLGLCTFAAWLVGVTVTTSYFPLSPIWLCLGMLLVWDKVFVAVPVPVPAVVRRVELVPMRRSGRIASGVVG